MLFPSVRKSAVPGPGAEMVGAEPQGSIHVPAGMFIRVTVRTMNTTAYIAYRYVLYGEDGNLQRAEDRLLPAGGAFTGNYADNDFYIPIGPGFLVQFEIGTGNNIRYGDMHVTASIGSSTGQSYYTMVDGFVGFSAGLQWPNRGTGVYLPEGFRSLLVLSGTNPGAGSQVSETVPTNTLWKIHSVVLSLVTDATVATRLVHLVIDNGTTTVLDIPAADSQTASLTRTYVFSNAPNRAAAGGVVSTALPGPLYVSEAYRVRTLLDNGVAGDDFAAPVLWVQRQFLET